ncbi:MAG: spore maturation protein A [Clostridia bacterium]|nr:spore maturation protein A [Clostridia bacterium]
MLNFIWTFLVISSFVYSFFAGTTELAANALLESAKSAVEFMLTTGAVMVMWSGFMEVAKVSGLTNVISKIMSPFIRRAFKGIRKNSEEENLISTNLAANMMGLSNAATPLGMKAMRKLSEKSDGVNATDNMCMLCIINCASLQIIPSTLIAMRSSSGSASPGEITVPIWIVSSLTLVFAVILAKFMERGGRK